MCPNLWNIYLCDLRISSYQHPSTIMSDNARSKKGHPSVVLLLKDPKLLLCCVLGWTQSIMATGWYIAQNVPGTKGKVAWQEGRRRKEEGGVGWGGGELRGGIREEGRCAFVSLRWIKTVLMHKHEVSIGVWTARLFVSRYTHERFGKDDR